MRGLARPAFERELECADGFWHFKWSNKNSEMTLFDEPIE
jgi:hypothetical protein